MSIVLARRLLAFHVLLEMALKDERARPRPDDRTVATIKKKKLAVMDRLVVFDGRQAQSGSHQRP